MCYVYMIHVNKLIIITADEDVGVTANDDVGVTV